MSGIPHGVVIRRGDHGMVEILDDFAGSLQMFSPDDARAIAARLVALADEIDAADKPDRKTRTRRTK